MDTLISNRRLLFPVSEDSSPSGGRKFIYDIVDFLNDAGIEAWVVHPFKGFRLTWFNNNTKVTYSVDLFPNQRNGSLWRKLHKWFDLPELGFKRYMSSSKRLTLCDSDVIVLPETRMSVLHHFSKKVNKIILNQGPYLIFSLNMPDESPPKQNFFGSDVLGMVTVSDLNKKMQEFVFPKLKVVQGRIFVDEAFKYNSKKKLQISYMPRRGNKDAIAVLNMLRYRGLSAAVKFIPIDGVSQSSVANIMSESLIFLSFSHREGFGLPAAEALASGCIVIGYTGNSGDEYFDPVYSFPIDEGDLIRYVETIEKVVRDFYRNPDRINNMRKLASETILSRYSKTKSKESMVSSFSELLTDNL